MLEASPSFGFWSDTKEKVHYKTAYFKYNIMLALQSIWVALLCVHRPDAHVVVTFRAPPCVLCPLLLKGADTDLAARLMLVRLSLSN